MLLVIDNYDSFTYNLVQYLGELGAVMTVARNDAITIRDIEAMRPDAIVISPGPCTPNEAGVSVDLIKSFHQSIPILGVCLGHQAIGQAFGGTIVKAPVVVHGKVSSINHAGKGIFNQIPNKFSAARYHSLVIGKEHVPNSLEVTAWSDDGTIMAVQHTKYPTFGVQFHPESIATKHGKILLDNFLKKRY